MLSRYLSFHTSSDPEGFVNLLSVLSGVWQAGVGSAASSARPSLLHADCSPRSDQETDPVQDHAVVTANKLFFPFISNGGMSVSF